MLACSCEQNIAPHSLLGEAASAEATSLAQHLGWTQLGMKNASMIVQGHSQYVRDDLVAIGHAYDWWRKCKEWEQWKTIIQMVLNFNPVLRTGKRVKIIMTHSRVAEA